MKNDNGFLYVANKQKFLDEALLSLKSLRRFNKEPVCLVCTPDLETKDVLDAFDVVITDSSLDNYSYMAKVVGIQQTPFQKTVFLDSDTFITDTISELFDILDIADFACTSEAKMHSFNKLIENYKNVFPEFNTGIVVYRNNTIMQTLIKDWLDICQKNNVLIDMPVFREAVLKNYNNVKYVVLPEVYNLHGFKSMVMLYGKVKIIHERLSYKRGYITPYFGPFDYMDAFAKRINKHHYKRLYIPKIGIIPYSWSPINIILFVKKKLKFKRISKNE